MLHIKRSFLLCLALFAANFSSGQVANSPFSSFGLGDTYGNGLAQHQGMGGVGISNPSSWYINNQNPALLTYNYVTTFQASIILENRTINDGTSSVKTGTGNLNYLAVAFPIKSGKWSTSLGLMPFSSANYKFTTVDNVLGDPTAKMKSQQIGTGGLNQFYWSNGVKIHKYISVGARISYLFGSLVTEKTQTLSFDNPNDFHPIAYVPLVKERNYMKDLTYSLGVYFHKDSLFKKNYRASIGFVYDFKTSLNTLTSLELQKNSVSGQNLVTQTISENVSGKVTLPPSFGAGISFSKISHWTVAADINILDYSQFSGLTDKVSSPTTGFRGGFGIEFLPEPTGSENYLKRITYRTGVSYEKYPYLANGNQVKDLGINFGLSLPVGISTLDLSLKIGKRGSVVQNSIDENYFKFYFGMTFNDRWFIKRKFD